VVKGITLVAQINIHKKKLSLVKKKTNCTGNSINLFCQIMFETVKNNLSFSQCTKTNKSSEVKKIA
jgi:hypothetical protein